jgi:hypothetical protein
LPRNRRELSHLVGGSVVCRLPRGFAFSCCGHCAESIPERNAAVDIDSHEIYTVALSLKSHELLAHIVDRDAVTEVFSDRLAERENELAASMQTADARECKLRR